MTTMSTEWLAALRGPRQWKADDARRVLAAWRRSGQSLAAFSQLHGVNKQRITWWRARLGSTSLLEATAPMTLVPLTVRAATVPHTAGAALSLVIGDGLRLDVADASRVPPLWLAGLIDALSAGGR